MPRRHNYAETRSTWSEAQLAMMEEMIDDAEKHKCSVPWRDYLVELGHPLGSVRTMASRIRARHIAEKNRATNRMIRAINDAAASYKPPAERKIDAGVTDGRRFELAGAVKPPIAAKPCDGFDHARCTSTQRMTTMAEIQARIQRQGSITGGILGDPVPGRSALDRKHGAGLVTVAPTIKGDAEDGVFGDAVPGQAGTSFR